jgi:hypothetical protein
MKRIAHIVTIIGVVLPMLMSCRAISDFLHDDEAVAQVGQVKLYRSELDKVIPKGVSQEDSTRLAQQYINTWASDMVFVNIAEEQLSKAEKDVTKELEDYRKSLLKYRYEQLYVNERLDTSVTDDMVEEYYNAHQDKFILERPVVKARYLNISADSPNLEPIRRRMSSDDASDLVEADSIAYISAMQFATWDNRWIDIVMLSREFEMDYAAMIAMMKKGWVEQKDTLGNIHLAYVNDIIMDGQPAPVEYSAPVIKDMIISARKQNLVLNLEQDLLKDARENGKFVIY